MFSRFATGNQLANQCWTLLKENREWLKIPLLSSVAVTVFSIIYGIASTLIVIVAAPSSSDRDSSGVGSILGIALLFIYYLVTYGIVIYSETALVSIVLMKIKNEKSEATASDGFALARQRLPAIIGFAALSATVGVIARLISNSGRESKNLVVAIVMSILASLIQAAWGIMTIMVTPVIAVEDLGTFPAISRSWQLFKQTWGEQVAGNFSLGFLGCLLTLAAMAPGALIAALGGVLSSPPVLGVGVVILFIGIAVISLVTTAAGAIFKAVMYQYATEGNTGGVFEEAQLRQVFTPARA
jgi:hypothetical protein